MTDDKQFTDKLAEAFGRLRAYCEAEDYRGWDPYDGLNSKVFKAIPLVGRSAICRLVWIQLFKRCPWNMRRALLVPKQHNAKGIGLFLQGYCDLWHIVDGLEKAGDPASAENAEVAALAAQFGTKADIEKKINYLGDLLLTMRAEGFSGSAWGYNFPWQCRREFLFPAGEPTVVATQFCAWALLDAAAITGRTDLHDAAVSAADFVLSDLHRTPHRGGQIISYSRMQGNDTIYNASLLGSRLLARVWKETGRQDCLDLARQSVEACCAEQRQDGSWTYGLKAVTGWIDSFHTGYNLDGLIAYQQLTGDTRFADNISRGAEYYVENFFTPDGVPKYYNNSMYPIDIHCTGQLPVTLSRLGLYDRHKPLVHKVMSWAIDNMQDPKGYFYYQLKRGKSSHISYMRWSNAFMFASMAAALRSELCGK